MPAVDRHLAGESHAPQPLRVTVEHKPGAELVVMRVRGAIDADGSRSFDHCLRTRIPPECRFVVVDLHDVDLLSAPGVRVLIEHSDRLALAGRRLVIAAANAHVRRILRLIQIANKVETYDDVRLAIAARTVTRTRAGASPPDPPTHETVEPQEEIHRLRAALRTRPTIARALGVLQERYAQLDADEVFELLRTSAQRHHLRLGCLARAVLAEPRPQGPVWFPGRDRLPAPSLSFLRQEREHRRNLTATLTSFLDEIAGFARTSMVSVELLDLAGPVLRLEMSREMPADLVDHLAETSDGSAPAMRAVADGQRVIIGADEPLLVQRGIATIQCTPLVTVSGDCVGVVTTYHLSGRPTPTPLQLAKVDYAATEIATWLDWHARTVVRDALEHLHHSATCSVPAKT